MNRIFSNLTCLLVIFLLVFSSSNTLFANTGSDQTLSEDNKIENLTNEAKSEQSHDGYTVKVKSDIDDEMSNDIYSSSNVQKITDEYVSVENPEDALKFARPEQIEYIEPNYYVTVDDEVVIPNDPRYGQWVVDEETGQKDFIIDQWNLEMVNVPYAWNKGYYGNGVKLGMIDTGIMPGVKDLNYNNIVKKVGFEDGEVVSKYYGTSNHGTRTTSVIHSIINNKLEIAGITDEAKVVSMRVSNKTELTTGNDIIAAIDYAIDQDVDVINMSMGMSYKYTPLEEQVNLFALKGGIFVASAGNKGGNVMRYPACFPNVICVGNVERSGEVYESSNYHEFIDVVAPGNDVPECFGTGSGTSLSAPHVSALAIVAKEYSNGKINVNEFRELLKITSHYDGKEGDSRTDKYGYGIIDFKSFIDEMTPDNTDGSIPVLPYSITYKVNHGKIKGKYERFYYGDDTVELPKDVEKNGYYFRGWYDNSRFAGERVYKINAGQDGNKKYYAKWVPRAYKVKLHSNGGTKLSNQYKNVQFDEMIGSLSTPKRKGYNFAGWYTNRKSGGVQYTKDRKYVIPSNATLYARWTRSKIVKFNGNKGRVFKYSKQIFKNKQLGSLPTPRRDGYSFYGWYTKRDGGKQYTRYKVNKQRGNITLYAKWTKKNTAKFNTSGGQVHKHTAKYSKGKRISGLPKPTKKGFKFKGWYTKQKSGSKIYNGKVIKTDEMNTLYARWKK